MGSESGHGAGDADDAYRGALLRMRATIEEEHRKLVVALRAVPEARLFVPIAPTTNSPGNLALHLGGNLRTLVGLIAGDVAYVRDRDREFRASGLSAEQTLAELADGVRVTLEVMDALLGTPERWAEPAPQPKFPGETRGDHVVRAVVHFTYHAGQIVLQAKIHGMMAQGTEA